MSHVDEPSAEETATPKLAPTTETPFAKPPQRVRTWDRGPIDQTPAVEPEPSATPDPVEAEPAAEHVAPVEEAGVVTEADEPAAAEAVPDQAVAEQVELFDAEEPVAEEDEDESIAEEAAPSEGDAVEAEVVAEESVIADELEEAEPVEAELDKADTAEEPATDVEPVEADTDDEPEAPAAEAPAPEETSEDDDAPAADDSAESGSTDETNHAEDATDAEEAPASRTGFAELGLKPALLTALTALGYEEPTPIQRQAIPELLNGRDIVGQAATGTGKTAAFALPILNGIEKNDAAIPLALIVTPTRELAVQVSEAFFKYGRESRVKVVLVFGGQPISRQLQALKRGVHVVVGTPGRVIDHIKRGSLNLDAIQTVVLDEADEMLDMGFTEDIESILDATPDSRQTVLFSATMPPRIAKIAKTYQRDPITVQIAKSKGEEANPLIRQTVYMVLRAHKASALGRVLDVESPTSAIVFCRTRHEVDELTVTMNGRGYRAEALHGGMDQKQRDRVMARLRDGTAELLVATDVAARGLDVDTLTHVVNYDVPSAPESYVHRIGRVGRAGREGVAITIAEPRQRRLLGNIERLTKQKFVFEKVPTVADLRSRQIETTIASVREALAVQDLEDFRPVLDALGDEFSERDIALAAIKLVHQANVVEGDDRDIPDASDWKQGKGKAGRDGGGKGKGKGKFDKGRKGKSFDGPKGYVYIDIGRKVGLRPGDVVGAIANEAGLSGSEIGPIKISDHYAVAGVPDNQVDSIVKSMKKAKIRGKQAKVRRYTE